ncbi:MAG: DUF1156 domain-containing protein [Planctomycetes bacterium]|nr:DUF1156 domain-containing protein [Planctomycetota bacterium]
MSERACPRLIEVALPIREISAESVRDKSLRHGHISTLHLWWARRPLAASRGIVFASLVPDPDDERCPPEFRLAFNCLLKDKLPKILQSYGEGKKEKRDPDPYRPYDGVPDTPRNRLLTFIAKWSPEYLDFEKGKSAAPTKPDQLLDDRSLVKWETSDPENPQGQEILNIARQLIRVAHGCTHGPECRLEACSPKVLDPFAGGGSIPLEATRLGCQAIANDYNPVAYLILRATCEFPQKFGKPGWRELRDGGGGGGQASSLTNWRLKPENTLSLLNNPETTKTRRDLPHWELEGKIYMVTFQTHARIEIPPTQRQIVLDAFKHWNGSRVRLHIACVMPDHVHAILEPLGNYTLSNLLHSIKSFTANEINKALGRQGTFWQAESFDRIVRDIPDYLEKWDYVRANPVKTGLVKDPTQHQWLFEDEVVKRGSLKGRPPPMGPERPRPRCRTVGQVDTRTGQGAYRASLSPGKGQAARGRLPLGADRARTLPAGPKSPSFGASSSATSPTRRSLSP